MQPRYATSMQTMLSKLPRKLEQTAEFYPSRRDFRTTMGEKAQKCQKCREKNSGKSQVDSSDCISLLYILNLANFARFHRFISADSSVCKSFERFKSATTDFTKPINAYVNSSDSTHFSHLAESALFYTIDFTSKLHTQRIYDDR